MNDVLGARPFKGALVAVGSTTRSIIFQYNPTTVTRSLQPQAVGGAPGDRSEAVIFTGAPVETIEIEIELDATDQLALAVQSSVEDGILPQLAALQLLVYPNLTQVRQNASQLASGVMEVGPFTAPVTLFVWGPKRVVPVRVNQFTIVEQFFNQALNPIRARISLSLRALSYSDLAQGVEGYNLYMSYQQSLQNLAQTVDRLGLDAVTQQTGTTSSQLDVK